MDPERGARYNSGHAAASLVSLNVVEKKKKMRPNPCLPSDTIVVYIYPRLNVVEKVTGS
jgi:hypothetical protein